MQKSRGKYREQGEKLSVHSFNNFLKLEERTEGDQRQLSD
jgi:hypothetical protein